MDRRAVIKYLLKNIRFSPTFCWEWTGPVDDRGRPVVNWGGKKYKAARLSYEAFNNRKLNKWQNACHRCANPICISPKCLEAWTAKEKIGHCIARGMFPWPNLKQYREA